MKVTVDTNILISATFWYGPSNQIIEKAEKKEIELVLSPEIIKEFIKVLEYEDIQEKIKNKNLEMNLSIKKIISISEIIEPKLKLNIVKKDTEDNKVLECAKAGKANFVITKDKHLLYIKEFEGIKILTPEEFLKLFG